MVIVAILHKIFLSRGNTAALLLQKLFLLSLVLAKSQ